MDFSTKPVLQVMQATIFQGETPVLSDVNFSVEQHEFVFLIGRTGSGKSSLLKTLYADLKLQSGLAEIVGYSLTKIKNSEVPFLRRKIGIIFQDFQLFSDRTVWENLLFVLKATGWTDPVKIKERISEVLIQVGLTDSLQKMPHQLSGGEQQRVVIARALLNEPSILLADEPTGNLDPDVADGIFKLFQDINKKGTAILMATHNHELLRKFPYRVLKCEKGRLLDSQLHDVSFGSSF
ncbi:MAG: ATP-binding cassette domain-containing protein [Algoriphagus sp.]|jgi:cell division transport system ATP-binding protein|uniref:cell division ATP-binding protein FtsE n=1 Tax=Algoriphagus sp. TaxID=1872435 RepID=UPI002717966C|nr:ATP-binding cassette domain-containing protein [Algoriphagus sp.]MDO8968717.1 ATP-binding cassette domain-containing protein [Algoriphagus sp.]MDP2040438.1 ATP-binding cassette domain-containing protein [Algoriphagus sp.]MDP3199365.1 ATP-binding cassette domain-containing protein [Algoriphagus sp.]MDP3472026.1 ATP-binding cassette domain-containing protein [Algoriphagus sp.]